MEKVICNIFEIGTLKNLHFDTNVAVVTEAFVNVWNKLVLAVVIFYKMADTKVNKSQIQIICIHWNRLFTYLYFDHDITSLGRAGHDIYGY